MGSLPHSNLTTESLLDRLPVRTLADLERLYMQHILKKHAGCVTMAANYLGVARATMYRKVKEYGLSR